MARVLHCTSNAGRLRRPAWNSDTSGRCLVPGGLRTLNPVLTSRLPFWTQLECEEGGINVLLAFIGAVLPLEQFFVAHPEFPVVILLHRT
ncbi:hypothetical protein BDW75DRAFT_87355 [Aspergillus navahoensis]